MKKITLIIFTCLLSASLFAQNISTGEVTLSGGIGYTVQIDISDTAGVTLTMVGPSNGYLGLGFDTMDMETAGKDCLIYLEDAGATNQRLSDRSFNGNTSTPTADSAAQQDWTITSNSVNGTTRTLVATRVLNTGNSNDYVFSTSLTGITLAWSHRPGSFGLGYHGGDRGATTASFSTLSTPDFNASTKFSIFPNPGNDVMTISLPSLTNGGLALEVFDVLGKKVYTQNLNTLNSKINISKWNSGLYLVRLSSPNQDITLTKRFVKL